jgi:hypothetical protein
MMISTWKQELTKRASEAGLVAIAWFCRNASSICSTEPQNHAVPLRIHKPLSGHV